MICTGNLDFLRHAFHRTSVPLDQWRITRHVDVPRQVALNDEDVIWQPLDGAWGSVPGTWWIRGTFTVPDGMDGQPVALRLRMHSDYPHMDARVPWAVGLHMHFEGLVFVNGRAFHGLDPNRDEVLLAESARAGDSYDIAIEAYTTSPRPKVFLAHAAVPDRDVRGFYYDLVSLLELAEGLRGAGSLADVMALVNPEAGETPAVPSDSSASDTLQALAEEVVASLRGQSENWHAQIAACRERIRAGLAVLTGPLADVCVNLIGHCHIDTAWLWRIAETRRKVGRTFATNLRYTQEFEDFTFVQSAPVGYEFCRRDYPELYAEIREAVAAGKWCPEGGMYVEADCNMPSGEALVRQLLYGKQFFQNEFGVDSRILWLPDVFGFTGSLPQLLKQAGIELFFNTKVRTVGRREQPLNSFWWEGIDGTRIMALFAKSYINWASGPAVVNWALGLKSRGSLPLTLMPFGYGDGGGGAAKADIETVSRWKDLGFFPKAQFTTAAAFVDKFAELSRTASETEMPVKRGDLYLEAHRGTYTSVARIKQQNRNCEQRLLEAETWSAIATARTGEPFPADQLEQAWKSALLNQFHDILPGSSIPEVYLDADKTSQSVLSACAEATISAFGTLAGDGSEALAANALGHPVSGLVEIPASLRDHRSQTLTEPNGDVRHYAWADSVPGWALEPLELAEIPEDGLHWDGVTLHTPFWRVQFNSSGTRIGCDEGGIASLYDRVRQRAVLAGTGNKLQVFHDEPPACEPWEMVRGDLDRPVSIFHTVSQHVLATGPLMFVMRTTYRGDRSTLVQDMRFYVHTPRIDFVTYVDWHERRKMLKVAFPLNIESDASRAETAFGWLQRPMTRNTPVEEEQFETPMHRWIDLSTDGFGVALLNDCKYGYDGHGKTLRLTLLKSAGFAQIQPAHEQLNPLATVPEPDAWADDGLHQFTYALMPHDGDLADGIVIRAARALNQPLRLFAGAVAQAPFVDVSAPNVVAETLKQAEDGDGLVLRFYEAAGAAVETDITLDESVQAWQACDILERPVDGTDWQENRTAHLTFRGFEVKSLRLKLVTIGNV